VSVFGVSVVRNEDDIIGKVCRHLLASEVDHLIVMDHDSNDMTRAVLADVAAESGAVTILRDNDPGHFQAQRITSMALQARAAGADWVLPFDADEFWYWPDGTLGEFFAQCPFDTVSCTGWDHIGSARVELSPWRRPEPQTIRKVAFRPTYRTQVDEGNHHVKPEGRVGVGLELRHFQYRSFAHMVRTVRRGAAAADAAGQHPMYAAHWRDAAALSDEELRAEWEALCATPGLVYDPAPVQS
jgi:hypothetical protein